MTTLFPVEQVCGVCGGTSKHNVVGSTNIMGASDLDMRPAPMARWTLGQQVQCCPYCGYCAGDISEATERAAEVVRTDDYQTELARESLPELTRRFLCAAVVLSADGDDAAAGHFALKGAWAADDVGDEEAARLSRRLAVAYFEADWRSGLTFADDEPTADALIADLYRRMGEFEEARGYALAGIEAGAEGLVRHVLELQVKLAEARDMSCHSVDEVDDETEEEAGFTIIM